MLRLLEIKKEFLKEREILFSSFNAKSDAFTFSKNYSVLIEDTIRIIIADRKFSFALASAGSFSRRELSPYSDVDLMIISDSIEKDDEEIKSLITDLWDGGIEASHTVREAADIQKYLTEDLHTFTQFFETRFISGDAVLYNNWNSSLLNSINDESKKLLITNFINDVKQRYEKYGDSPKMLEPNVKMSAGGLRDFQSIEWMMMITSKQLLNSQHELTEAEIFINHLKKNKLATPAECKRLLESYKLILSIRHLLHIISKSKTDRLEFTNQLKLAKIFGYEESDLMGFMKNYFNATNIVFRVKHTLIKKYKVEYVNPVPDSLSYDLDDDFYIKNKVIYQKKQDPLTLSDIFRVFYYRVSQNAGFDDHLRTKIIEATENAEENNWSQPESSVFFREILKFPRHVGSTLAIMNELGVLGAFLPEFGDLNGFMQHGVYHCYTADEHTLITIRNLEKLANQNSPYSQLYNSIKDKEILNLALLLHDIAKPIDISGHEIIGAEMASSIMIRLGYEEDEINKVCFLVKNHLMMEQVAFRRNLNDPETLNGFASKFNSIEELDLLYLITYADLSAVNPAVWTSWKAELLSELYRKSKAMIEDKISGEELLYSTIYSVPKDISKHSSKITENNVQDHFESLHDDLGYANHFTDEEIALHIEEIIKGDSVSVLFKELDDFTNVTVITKDFPSLLSKLCGVFAINDANIHSAKIFTRKDGIVIDTFLVTDFRTHKRVDTNKYEKIKEDFYSVINGFLELHQEVAKLKSRWWRIENKLFKRSGQIKITFEKHDRYTIIDVHSPDRLGFLYHVTNKMNKLGLIIYFAKISTKGDDIVDSFYVLDRNGHKVSQNDYQFIISELTDTITQIL
ncbi:MAG: HD domain-containing protein [Ignavibacterium sp.]|jgi:[protein-PII] uridylyltransferase|nr:HD domain-containing protein [Ignavibacterium sp.]